nr:callose synthase 9 [Ipomoea batatas]
MDLSSGDKDDIDIISIGGLIGMKNACFFIEIRSLDAIQKRFERFPAAFMDTLHVHLDKRASMLDDGSVHKFDAARFAPFWNEIIMNLREEDYINSLEMELLLMPKNSGNLSLVQWPLFLLASKIFLAKDTAVESRESRLSQEELWDRISRDDYMKYAVEECFFTIQLILTSVLDDEGKKWVQRIYEEIQDSIKNRSIYDTIELNKLPLMIQKVTALLGILKEEHSQKQESGAVNALQDLYDVMRFDVLHVNMREHMEIWNDLSKARNEGRLFQKLKWPTDVELRAQVRRLYSLLTIKDSAANIPKNLEARRRLDFFTNSLFMEMPAAKPVREMLSFSVFTPYYSETVLYSMPELLKKNEDGISTLFYLQKIYPDEWRNFLTRIGRDENISESDLSNSDIPELRFWASYRGQTLARTVRGMMYYRKALMLQAYLERMAAEDSEAGRLGSAATDTEGFELSPEARAQADLKFTYVVTCQIYGKQKEDQKPEAADIALLMQRNEALRVAFIDEVETLKDGKVNKEYFSKLVKADINGKDKNFLKSTGSSKRQGKTSFVEHRTFLHLYHSFHRLWIFLVMMFQGLTIIAFNNGDFNSKTLREVLSLGPTYFVMKFLESVLDVIMMYGAYSTSRRLAVSRIFLRFLWFSAASVLICFLYVKGLVEKTKPNADSVLFKIYVIVLAIYAGVHFFIGFLLRIPACHQLTNKCDQWPLIRFIKWMHQEHYYVGRGMYERTSSFIKYLVFWLVVLGGKFSFAYFLLIKPLVDPTTYVVQMDIQEYSWHDFVSKKKKLLHLLLCPDLKEISDEDEESLSNLDGEELHLLKLSGQK